MKLEGFRTVEVLRRYQMFFILPLGGSAGVGPPVATPLITPADKPPVEVCLSDRRSASIPLERLDETFPLQLEVKEPNGAAVHATGQSGSSMSRWHILRD